LVVDDEQSVLKLAKNLLETHGYRVLTAGDGREALATFSVHCAAIRAVIIDLMMPNLGGGSTIKEMRARASSLPIIAISGASPQDGEAGDYVGEGIVFLSKPFTVQRLLTALQDALASMEAAAIHESVASGNLTGPVNHQLAGAAIRMPSGSPVSGIPTAG
jgi:DNA-binding NtrC family response regulator